MTNAAIYLAVGVIFERLDSVIEADESLHAALYDTATQLLEQLHCNNNRLAERKRPIFERKEKGKRKERITG